MRHSALCSSCRNESRSAVAGANGLWGAEHPQLPAAIRVVGPMGFGIFFSDVSIAVSIAISFFWNDKPERGRTDVASASRSLTVNFVNNAEEGLMLAALGSTNQGALASGIADLSGKRAFVFEACFFPFVRVEEILSALVLQFGSGVREFAANPCSSEEERCRVFRSWKAGICNRESGSPWR